MRLFLVPVVFFVAISVSTPQPQAVRVTYRATCDGVVQAHGRYYVHTPKVTHLRVSGEHCWVAAWARNLTGHAVPKVQVSLEQA